MWKQSALITLSRAMAFSKIIFPPSNSPAPFVIALTIGIALGIWASSQQILMVAPDFLSAAPISWRLPAIGFTTFTVLSFYMMVTWLARRLPSRAQDQDIAYPLALSLLPLLAVVAGAPLQSAALVSVLAVGAIILPRLVRSMRAGVNRPLLEDFGVFIGLAVLLYFTAGFYSPAVWESPIGASYGYYQQEIMAHMRIQDGFINAKHFGFSDFEYSYWGAAPIIPTSSLSYPLMFLALLLDVPSADPEGYLRIFIFVFYCTLVAGAFGFYLLCRRQFDFNPWVSAIGGAIFVLGNRSFQNHVVGDAHLLITSYCLTPYILIGMLSAFRTGRKTYAVGAGISFALPMFISAPHPDGIGHATLTLSLIIITALFFGHKNGAVRIEHRLGLSILGGVVAVGLSAHFFLPLIDTLRSDNLIVFGHASKSTAWNWANLWDQEYSYWVPPVVIKTLFFIVILLTGWRKLPQWRAVMASIVIIFLVLAATYHPLGSKFIIPTASKYLYMSPGTPGRMSMWLHFTAFLIMVSAIHVLAEFISTGAGRFRFRHYSLWTAIKGKIRPIVSIPSAFAILFALPISPIHEGTRIANPGNCPYYVTLATITTISSNLRNDTANTRLLKSRLSEYQRQISDDPAALAASRFTNLLARYGGNIDQLSPDATLTLARESSTEIDTHRLASSCYNPLVLGPQTPKRTVFYALDGMYKDISSQFMRVFGATADRPEPELNDTHLGLKTSGINHAATTALDTRFMMAYPLIHALYLIPGHEYENRGFYKRPMPWNLMVDEVLSPKARKVLNIAGIDIFTVAQEGYAKLTPETLAGLEIIATAWDDPRFTGNFVALRNLDSYGIAYVASNIQSLPPENVRHTENIIRSYFRNLTDRPTYHKEVENLREKLLALGPKYSALVETTTPLASTEFSDNDAGGSINISGMAGPRIAFDVNCQRPQCFVGVNMAAVPGWRAAVDGKVVPTYRTNMGFFGFEVPEGPHKIALLFMPWSEPAGWALSSVMWIIILLMLIRGRKHPFAPSRKAGQIGT